MGGFFEAPASASDPPRGFREECCRQLLATPYWDSVTSPNGERVSRRVWRPAVPGEYVEVHKLLGIVVELSPGGEEVFSERVSAVLRAWARLVEIGAFAGDNGVHSWAQPPRVQLGLEDEIELTLEDAHVPADAYAPLLVALDEIDRAGQAIGRLEAGP